MMLRFFLFSNNDGRTEEIRALDQISRVLIYIHIMHIYIEKWVKEERVLADNKPASSKAKNKTERLHEKRPQEYESLREWILSL